MLLGGRGYGDNMDEEGSPYSPKFSINEEPSPSLLPLGCIQNKKSQRHPN
jgi:hypothetical protein